MTVYAPGGPGEASLLAVLACLTFVTLARPAGVPFAALTTTTGLAGFVLVGHEGFPVAVALFALFSWVTIRSGRRSPHAHAWLPFASQILILLGALALYVGARMLIEGEFPEARANALRIVDMEAAIRLHFESDLQALILRSDHLTQTLNIVYSFYFLPFVVCTLLWLFLFHPSHYRLMRNSLGASVVLAVVTIAFLPVAPPRLVPESGMVDTITLAGRAHTYSNEYAAVPSLHVGWMFLAGYALGLTVHSKWRYLVAAAPGVVMLVTVIATGNHYWVDGLVGTLFALGPALVIRHWPSAAGGISRGAQLARRTGLAAHRLVLGAVEVMSETPKSRFTSIALGGLLALLVVGELLAPGFTAFWGYLVFQMFVTLALLVAGERVFRNQGGLSWQTHVLAVACSWADTFGTAGDLYANIAEYDKITHFAGVAAVTAAAYDCLRALARRGSISPWVESRFRAAIAAGIAVGIAWEVYEALADDIFATKRVQGRLDTTYDLVFDTLGAFVAAIIVRWAEHREVADEHAWDPERIVSD